MIIHRYVCLITGEISLDGKFSSGPFDQDCQLNGLWSSKIDQRIKSCPCRASGIKNIVNQNNHLIVDIKAYLSSPDLWLNTSFGSIEVISVKCDVQGSLGDLSFEFFRERPGQSLGDDLSPASDPNNGQIITWNNGSY